MMTCSACPVSSTRSGASTCTEKRLSSSAIDPRRPDQSDSSEWGLGQYRLGSADVEEGLLGNLVELAVDQGLERLDRLLHRHGDTLQAGEHLTHVEGLRQEA